eukprot:jgi/Botrbrau1/12495/Bobra.0169s0042.1
MLPIFDFVVVADRHRGPTVCTLLKAILFTKPHLHAPLQILVWPHPSCLFVTLGIWGWLFGNHQLGVLVTLDHMPLHEGEK